MLPFFFKKMVSKMHKDLNRKGSEQNNYKKHRTGDAEVSYKEDNSIDPGGEYVEFEDLDD